MQVWRPNPQLKVEVGSTEVKDETLTVQVLRPINNVSYAVLVVNDYQSKKYIDVFDVLLTLHVSFRYGSDSWTKVFSGTISTVAPRLTRGGEVLEVAAWGHGNALVKTHCNTSYGKESLNPTIDTPIEVWNDLRLNYVNKSFGGSNTNYALTMTAQGGTAPTITYLQSPYKSNFEILNTTLDLITANQAGQPGHQWFVDPASVLHIRAINNNSDADWPEYWKGSQAASTIQVTKDMILYDFRKNVEEYANKIVLVTGLRKPGYDYWTENWTENGSSQGGSSLWGTSGSTVSDDSTNKVVGANSLLIENLNLVDDVIAYYPSGANATWDLTKIGSEKTVPTINFYAAANNGNTIIFQLFTSRTVNLFWTTIAPGSSSDFKHYSLPVGPYYETSEVNPNFLWNETGSPNWANINGIEVKMTPNTDAKWWLDDLHFSGRIVREAYDSTAITNNKEYQRVIRNDTAVDDTLVASDDSGTAGMLVYAELLRRSVIPIVAKIQVPLAEDVLPGQKVYIKACKKSDGTFRIQKDFRIVEVMHFWRKAAPATVLNLSDDVNNSHAFGVPSAYSLLMEYAGALGHAEAKNLKTSGVDLLIPRMSRDYPS